MDRAIACPASTCGSTRPPPRSRATAPARKCCRPASCTSTSVPSSRWDTTPCSWSSTTGTTPASTAGAICASSARNRGRAGMITCAACTPPAPAAIPRCRWSNSSPDRGRASRYNARLNQHGGGRMSDKRTTHFGYREVEAETKAGLVANVFHSVAARYDLMNDLMSGGIHRLWKRFTIELSGVRPGHRVLDIAGGTGDLAAKFSRLVGENGSVVLADINESMLRVGRDKLIDHGVQGNLEYVQADAQALPFPDDHFDCVSIAFGLRNVTDKDQALREMLRVLKPG